MPNRPQVDLLDDGPARQQLSDPELENEPLGGSDTTSISPEEFAHR